VTQILVVTTSVTTSEAVVNLLRTLGYDVRSACGFQAAAQALSEYAPEFLVSDLRLGAFNALHLAIRHRYNHPAMQTIVLDCVHDAGIEQEAKRQGAVYLVEPIDATELLARLSETLAANGPPRRWPRKAPSSALAAEIEKEPARIIDLSYGGVRVEMPEGAGVPATFDLTLPERDLVVRMKSVWTRAASRGWTWYGAETFDNDPVTVELWRRVVDSAGD
jgi:two-component system response regulator RegA